MSASPVDQFSVDINNYVNGADLYGCLRAIEEFATVRQVLTSSDAEPEWIAVLTEEFGHKPMPGKTILSLIDRLLNG